MSAEPRARLGIDPSWDRDAIINAATSLDTAWAEAEAALPDGWRLAELSNEKSEPEDFLQWCAFATGAPLTDIGGIETIYSFIDGVSTDDALIAAYGADAKHDPPIREGIGASPAAALIHLAAQLREVQRLGSRV
jgi:hypothetical protein